MLLFTLLFSGVCFAQSAYKLDKEGKKALKTLQKEGWQTLDEKDDLEQQFVMLKQLEEESSDKHIVAYAEWEGKSLQIAERRSWDAACSQIRNTEHANVSQVVTMEESVTSREGGKQEIQSDVIVSQRMNNKYVSTNTDLRKVFAIYRKTDKGYKVQMVVVKEIK